MNISLRGLWDIGLLFLFFCIGLSNLIVLVYTYIYYEIATYSKFGKSEIENFNAVHCHKKAFIYFPYISCSVSLHCTKIFYLTFANFKYVSISF